MRYFQIVFLLLFQIYAFGCTEKRTANEKFWDWFQYCTMGFGSSSTDSYKVEDRGDGTLEVMNMQDRTFCFEYKTQHKYSTQNIIKKCIQGQVYRAEQNDCKGKGTQADWWGAEKFQWCPTNDRACETKNSSGFYVYDYTKIPVFATCKNDTTVNNQWELISLDYHSSVAYLSYIQANRLEEIPMGDSYVYWGWGRTETDAIVFSLNESWISNYYSTKYAPKNTFQYVICTKIKGT